jgi:hypothetical protein
MYNAITSGLLQTLFPSDQMNAYMDDGRTTAIRIPPTFDMNYL